MNRDRRVIAPMALSVFAAIFSQVVIAPLISQISAEFGVTTGGVGSVVAAYGLPGILAVLVVGPYSDRLGRRPFLVGGAVVGGVFTILSALAPTFPLLLIGRGLAGLGAAAVIPNAQATIADNFAYHERGAAVAKVFIANTVGSIAGIAATGIVAEQLGWRSALALSGVLLIGAALVVRIVVPNTTPTDRPAAAATMSYLSVLRVRSAVSILVAVLLSNIAWTWPTFVVVFLQVTFGLPQGLASTYSLVLGVGQLIGSQVGGRLGDRIGQRLVVAGAMPASGLLLIAATSGAVPLAVVIVLQLLAAFAFGMRSTSNVVLMGEQLPDSRGRMMALGGVMASASTVIGTSAGGALVDGSGFGALAIFSCICAVLSSVIVLELVAEPHRAPAAAVAGADVAGRPGGGP